MSKEKETDLPEEKKQEWISVKERKPDVGVHVLVATEYYDRNKKLLQEVFVGYMNDESELVHFPDDWTGGDLFEDCVSHWQPLPEPPKL